MLQILVKHIKKPDLHDELSVCPLLIFFFKPDKNSTGCLDRKIETSFAKLDFFSAGFGLRKLT